MLITLSLLIALVINFLLFLVAFKRQSDKLTDFAYSLSFITVASAAVLLSSNRSDLLLAVAVMVLLWALRLGTFLVTRIRKTGKDGRFDGMREDFVKFIKFWLGQGVVAWMLLLPMLFLAERSQNITTLTWAGIAIWAIGLIIETVADQQKYAFKQSPANKGKWIESGLWKYSRHPNYFGEILVWIGLYLTVFSSLNGLQQVIGLISPLAIFYTLRFISGVPPLELVADKRWGNNADYKKYRDRTNLLVLSWPKTK